MRWNPVKQMQPEPEDEPDIDRYKAAKETVEDYEDGLPVGADDYEDAREVVEVYESKPPPEIDERPGPLWLEKATELDGRYWIPGAGPNPSDVMVIGHYTKPNDRIAGDAFSAAEWRGVVDTLREAGFAIETTYMTYMVKFLPKKKKPSAEEYKLNEKLLDEEIRRVNPRLVIAMGAEPFKRMTGQKLTDMRMTAVPHSRLPDVYVIGAYDPQLLAHDERMRRAVLYDWRQLARLQSGKSIDHELPPYRVIQDGYEAAYYLQELMKRPVRFAAVDCEWDGKTWMDPDGYLRTIQLATGENEVVVFELTGEGGVPVLTADEDKHNAFAVALKRFCEDEGTRICGHNTIADGEWLRERYNIDLRKRTVWDTMIAEHTLDSAGTFNLTFVAEKYCPELGKYDTALQAWVSAHPEETKYGYGNVPRELLLPYGAYDALVTWRIARAQVPLLKRAGFLERRGGDKEYCSLFEAGLGCQRVLYEMQQEGIGVDTQRLVELTDMYNAKSEELRGTLVTMAADLGLEDFNPASSQQCATLMFEILGLTPIQTTAAYGGMSWERVLQEPPEIQAEIAPSTDKTTLDILQDAHPVIKTLRDFRKVDYGTKVWLVPDGRFNPDEHNEASKGGGIRSKIWPDGRIHPVFSQLKETGRLSSQKPNCQNFPKRAEGDITRIFGKAAKPPDIRTIFVPRPGWHLLEIDWTQAELFALAALSGDDNMWSALNTPGKDLHDLTALDSFSLTMLDPDTRAVVTSERLVEIAAVSVEEYEAYVKTLNYLDQRQRIMDRSTFKNTIRVSAKNVNFGIPYGRSAAAIAVQVKGETGTEKTIQELTQELEVVVDTWKTKTYRKAWNYLSSCADSAVNLGYVENAWGRRRLFPRGSDTNVNAIRREAQNYPIQSTIADTCLVALDLIQKARDRFNLKFRIINQVHDAIIFEYPPEEEQACIEIGRKVMAGIKIPIIGRTPLQIGVDVEKMPHRWGEKAK